MSVMLRVSLALLLLSASACSLFENTPEILVPEVSMNQAPRTEALGNGACVMMHCDNWQSDTLAVPAALAPSQRIGTDRVGLHWSSPIAGGLFDRVYPDGQRVYWLAKTDRIQKLIINQNNQWQSVAELPVPTSRFPYYDAHTVSDWVKEFDALSDPTARADMAKFWRGYQQEALRAYNSLLDAEGRLFVASLDRVAVFGDVNDGQAGSGIEKRDEWILDARQLNRLMVAPEARSTLPIIVAMNMLSDGHLVLATLDGTVIVVDRAFKQARYHRLPGESIWNQIATDDAGGIYVSTSHRWRKLVWTGTEISDSALDGAWSLIYERPEQGVGATAPPVLMGLPEDDHRFVVVTNDKAVNEAVLLWRDQIPEQWQSLDGETNRRIAGRLPLTFGRENPEESRVELSPTVSGYSVVFARGWSRQQGAATLDRQLLLPVDSAASGLQQLRWSPESKRWQSAWVRPDVSSPNSVPVANARGRHLHVLGPANGEWVWRVLDWSSGRDLASYALGRSAAFNPVMLGLQLSPAGEPMYPAFGGAIRLRPAQNLDNGGWWPWR